jgi:hypothetical protein
VQIRLQEYQVKLSEISITQDQEAITEPREEVKAEGKVITGGQYGNLSGKNVDVQRMEQQLGS